MNVHSDSIALNETTASLRKVFFTLRDDVTNTVAQTGKTFSGSDIVVSKNGAAYANFGGVVAEIGNGDYSYQLSAGEDDTQGFDIVLVQKANCRPYRVNVRVGAKVDGASPFSFVVENGKTFAELIRLMSRTLFGKSSGGGTGSITFRDLADTKNSVVASVDGSGNRTAVTTLDGT